MTAERDRDARGRARNARPRDSLGRPLDRAESGLPLAADETLPPARALDLAQRYLDDGQPFHAHEVLEAVWKAGPPAERDLWQGLAQVAVGLTHARRGNARGAASLLRRGAGRLASYPHGRQDRDQGLGQHGAAVDGVDVDGVIAVSLALADRIESNGLAGLGPGDLTVRLRLEPGAAR